MAFLIGGANSAADTGYNVDNSIRFNGPDNSNLTQTSSGTPTNRRKCTVSFWIKHDCKSGNQCLIQGTDDSGANSYFQFELTDVGIDIQLRDGSGATYIRRGTKGKRIFRDPSAWYHFVVRFDSTEGSAGDRFRVYINGTQDPLGGSDDTGTVDSNYDFVLTKDSMPIAVGSNVAGGGDWSGYMAELVCIDGDSLAPTSFGEFDEDSPTIWKPIDVSGLTFGTNGFYCDFEDSGDLGDDESGNTNDFTENNLAAADQAIDTPTNNFCTFHKLATTNSIGDDITFSEGNCKLTNTSDGAWHPAIGTIGVKGGKWYAEFKVATLGGASKFGILDVIQYMERGNWADSSRGYGYEYNEGDATNNGNIVNLWGDSFTTNDIISVAMDLDNMHLYFAKNGTWQDSGDPESGATGTGTQDFFGGASNTANAAGVDTYAFAANIHNSSVTEANFGGCSAFTVSSGNADGNGYGNFEYAVPSGYYALCTKNLAEYG